MTCRVARLPQDHVQIDLAYCCKCGSSNVEMFWTSQALGPHLCPMCVQSKVECGEVESMTRSSRRGRVEAFADPSLEKELQSIRAT